jgi:hypothetical protein
MVLVLLARERDRAFRHTAAQQLSLSVGGRRPDANQRLWRQKSMSPCLGDKYRMSPLVAFVANPQSVAAKEVKFN